MFETSHHSIADARHQLPDDPTLLADFIEAWELARISFGSVLEAGVQRSDVELAKDTAYRQFLQAGLRIHYLGGPGAVGAVSACLQREHHHIDACHFQRLWYGLMLGQGH